VPGVPLRCAKKLNVFFLRFPIHSDACHHADHEYHVCFGFSPKIVTIISNIIAFECSRFFNKNNMIFNEFMLQKFCFQHFNWLVSIRNFVLYLNLKEIHTKSALLWWISAEYHTRFGYMNGQFLIVGHIETHGSQNFTLKIGLTERADKTTYTVKIWKWMETLSWSYASRTFY
jgi:hypothetical protein